MSEPGSDHQMTDDQRRELWRRRYLQLAAIYLEEQRTAEQSTTGPG